MSLNKSQKTRSCLIRWVSATTLLTTIVFSSVFPDKAEANHCGPLDFTGTCFNHGGDANTSEIGGGLVTDPTDYEKLTRQLYRQILGREPDPKGFRDNENAMRQHSFAWVRQGMAGSQESRNNINNLYRRYLCRDADPGGMDFHINLLASGKMALDQIRNGIANGAEAQQHKNGCR